VRVDLGGVAGNWRPAKTALEHHVAVAGSALEDRLPRLLFGGVRPG